MSRIGPTPEQLEALAAAEDDGPVVMVNLLRFRERAQDGQGSGRDAYARYAAQVEPLLAEAGARPLLRTQVEQVFIGADADSWDEVLIVEYPSRAAFLRMVAMPAYQRAHREREAALEATVLLATRK